MPGDFSSESSVEFREPPNKLNYLNVLHESHRLKLA